MREVYTLTGIETIPATERWSLFLEPLAQKLRESGLGEVLALSEIEPATDDAELEVEEVAIRLNNYEYGMDLVDRLVQSVGISQNPRKRPRRWRDYACDEYYDSEYAVNGYWHEPSQYWYIVPSARVCEDDENNFLIVGGSGFDGIRWGYRKNVPGFWAHPVAGEFVQMANDLRSFMPGWISGEIRAY